MTEDPKLIIPEIPANLTDAQIAALHLQFAQLGLVIANDSKNRQSIADLAVEARHREQLQEAWKRHEAANPPFNLFDLAAALAARARIEVTIQQLDAVLRERWEWLQGMQGQPVEPEPQIPLPLPVDELDPVFYLAELRDEFISHEPPWPATIEGARKHWQMYGKIQGRKGRADGPGWGPKAKDAPPGTQL